MSSEVPSASKVISPAKKQLFIVIIIVASASIVAIIGTILIFDGCIHSIMRRTGGDHDLVEYFVDTWCRLNSEVLVELEKKITEEPFRNYFC